MKLLRIDVENPEKDLILLVSDAIRGGKVLIYPTDTVYGVGCSVRSDSVRRVFEIKGRGLDNPLSVAFSSLEMVKEYVYLTGREEGFIRDNILKPFTFVVRKRASISGVITAGRDTVGVRIPDHRVVREIIGHAGVPIVTTSANFSGGVAPAGFDEIDRDFMVRVDLVIDSGRCRVGKPSTVVDVGSGRILRGVI